MNASGDLRSRLMSMLVALIPVTISTRAFIFYRLDTLFAGLVLSFLTSLLITNASVLISLRAASIRQAQQRIGLIMLSVIFLLDYVKLQRDLRAVVDLQRQPVQLSTSSRR